MQFRVAGASSAIVKMNKLQQKLVCFEFKQLFQIKLNQQFQWTACLKSHLHVNLWSYAHFNNITFESFLELRQIKTYFNEHKFLRETV